MLVVVDTALRDLAVRLAAQLATARIRLTDVFDARLPDRVLEDASVAIVAAGDMHGRRAVDCVSRLKAAGPHLTVFVIARNGAQVHQALSQFARAGADDFFLLSLDGAFEELAYALRIRMRAPPPKRAMWALAAAHVKLYPFRLLSWTILNAHRRPSIEMAARHFRTTRRTIARQLTLSGLPTFRELRSIGVILHLLEWRHRGLSLRQAARRLSLTDATIVSRSRGRWVACERMRHSEREWVWALPSLYELGATECDVRGSDRRD